MSEYSFDIGFRFYYWDYYKTRDPRSQMKQNMYNINDHRGYLQHDLYISPKYQSLKEEILTNAIFCLSVYKLSISITKTKEYFTTFKARNIKCSKFPVNDYLHYGISNGSPLKFSHLLSVILYTDWSDLSTEFSKSFRKLKKYESLISIKKRHTEYVNFAKNLRELIEYYGASNYMHEEKGPFYCGMSHPMVMPQFSMLN